MRGTATTRAWALTTAMDGDASSTTGQEQGPPLFALRGFVLYGSFGTWDSRSYLTNVLGSPSWSSMMASLAGAKAMTKASLFNEGLFAGAAASIRASNLRRVLVLTTHSRWHTREVLYRPSARARRDQKTRAPSMRRARPSPGGARGGRGTLFFAGARRRRSRARVDGVAGARACWQRAGRSEPLQRSSALRRRGLFPGLAVRKAMQDQR